MPLRSTFCVLVLWTGAVQFVEGVVFAINQVNANLNLLPGLTLGAVILDDCAKPVTALARALHFLPVHRNPTQECFDVCTAPRTPGDRLGGRGEEAPGDYRPRGRGEGGEGEHLTGMESGN